MKRYKVTLKLRGPVLTRDTALGAFGIDTPIARMPDDTPFLPGSHVWGKVRDALVNLKTACEKAKSPVADQWNLPRWCGGLRGSEGDKTDGDGGDEVAGNKRRLIHFHDFILVNESNRKNAPQRTRIAIDPGTGAALDAALQVLETPWDAGEEAIFTGAFTLVMDDNEAQIASAAVQKALNWVFQFGGLRTIGFGRTLHVTCVEDGDLFRSHSSFAEAGPQQIKITLAFDEPFLIAAKRETQNTYVSSDIIPGGVVKGALVSLLKASGQSLPGYFNNLLVTHLFPVADEEDRPVAIPHSFVSAGDAIMDAALLSANDPPVYDSDACAFRPDWKGEAWGKARQKVNWPETKTILRLRTAIDRDQRAAETNKLFGYEMRCTDQHKWTGEIRLDDIPQNKRESVAKALRHALANGLPGIGRTQAFAHVTLSDATAQAEPAIRDNCYILVLQTPALIRDPGEDYEHAFAKLSDGALTCDRWFVRERLAGASFIAARFFKGREYRPFLLSEAGCTFVLEPADGKEAEAEALIRCWSRRGIPVGDHLTDVYGFDSLDDDELWKQCPYIPQNGYGEIRVNQALHWNLRIPGGGS